MMHLLHLSPDIDRGLYLSLYFQRTDDDGQPSPALSETIAKLLAIPGAYVCVAAVEGEQPEDAWTLTQNGVRSHSWSLLPPEGIFPQEPTSPPGHPGYGNRSSDIGDLVIVNGTDLHSVATLGFQSLGKTDLKLPEPDTRLTDGIGRRIHTDMAEQREIAEEIADALEAGKSPLDTAFVICDRRGLAPRLAAPLADLGRSIAEDERGFVPGPADRSSEPGQA